MDQLFATFGINWSLLLIQIINFGALLALLTYLLYKPVLKMIDDRKAMIEKGVTDAEAAAKKLTEADSEARVIVGKGAKDAESLVADARARADVKGAEMVRAAEERAVAIQKDAEMRAQEASRAMAKESEKNIARVAMLAAEKILREKATK